MGNAYTQRRTRMRRPPVCKSKRKEVEDNYPATLDVHLEWTISSGMDFSTFGPASVPAARVPNSKQYGFAGFDNEGAPFGGFVTLELLPIPTTVNLTVQNAVLGFPTMNGSTNGWDGTVPYNGGLAALTEVSAGDIGMWEYSITVL